MNLYLFVSFMLLISSCVSEDILAKFRQNDYHIKDFRVEIESYNPEIYNYLRVVTFKHNRTTPAVNISLSYKIDVDKKNEQVVLQVYKFLSNEYRPFPIHFQATTDDAFRTNAVGIKAMLACGNVENLHFVKNKDYHVCNFIIDESKFPPLIPTGRYKLTVTFLYFKEISSVANGYGETYYEIPIPKNGKNKPKI